MISIHDGECKNFFGKTKIAIVDSGKRTPVSENAIPISPKYHIHPHVVVFVGSSCRSGKDIYDVELGVGQVIELPFAGTLSVKLDGDPIAHITVGE